MLATSGSGANGTRQNTPRRPSLQQYQIPTLCLETTQLLSRGILLTKIYFFVMSTRKYHFLNTALLLVNVQIWIDFCVLT